MRNFILLVRHELRLSSRTLVITGSIALVIIALPVIISIWLDGQELNEFMAFTCSVLEIWVFFLGPILGIVYANQIAGREAFNAHEWLPASARKRVFTSFFSVALLITAGAVGTWLFAMAGEKYFPGNRERFDSLAQIATCEGGTGFRAFMVFASLFGFNLIFLITLLILRLPRLLIQLSPYLFAIAWGMTMLIDFLIVYPIHSTPLLPLLIPSALIFILATGSCSGFWMRDLIWRVRIDNGAVIKGLASFAAGVAVFFIAAAIIVNRASVIPRYEIPYNFSSSARDSSITPAANADTLYLSDARGWIVAFSADGSSRRFPSLHLTSAIDLFLDPEHHGTNLFWDESQEGRFNPDKDPTIFLLPEGKRVMVDWNPQRKLMNLGEMQQDGSIRWHTFAKPSAYDRPTMLSDSSKTYLIGGSLRQLLDNKQQSLRISEFPFNGESPAWKTLPMDSHPLFVNGEAALITGTPGHFGLRWKSGGLDKSCDYMKNDEIEQVRYAYHVGGSRLFTLFTREPEHSNMKMSICSDTGRASTAWQFPNSIPRFINRNEELATVSDGSVFYTRQAGEFPPPVVITTGDKSRDKELQTGMLLHLAEGRLWLLSADRKFMWQVDVHTGRIMESTQLPNRRDGCLTYREEKGLFYASDTTIYYITWDGRIRQLGSLLLP